MRRQLLFASSAICALTAPAFAQEAGQVFTLGEVSASAPAPDAAPMGGATVTQDDIRQFNTETMDKAIDTVPGASVSGVGARNETDVWLRGFDRWRLRLSQDGIPIYLPADNRIDFSQFTTADLGEIQVSKGFTSVIDGPGAMGGAINLVSRQVARPFEGDIRVGSSFDQTGAFSGFVSDAFTGTKQDKWYVQAALSQDYQNHFRLSDSFTPGTLESGGNRDHSYRNAYKINLKAGYTPNATDEYSINVIDQMGEKDNPIPDGLVSSPATTRYWTWPSWDKQSVYWLSKTAIDDRGSYVKLRAYYDRFFNQLDSYDNSLYTAQILPKSFDSTYDDRASGGSAEISKMLLGGRDNIKAALHFRWDQHNAWEATNAKPGLWYSQPWLHDEETTTSVAVENTYHPLHNWDVTAGVSYDYRHMLKAQDWDSYAPVPATAPFGYVVNYPVSDSHAWNPELAVAYHYSPTGAVHASASQRTRFPTLFEMFSSRFGTFTGNPYLRPERSTNIETGVADMVGRTRLGANVFYSRITDAIEPVTVVFPAPVGVVSQNQNVGIETHRGFEVEASSLLTDTLEVGGNYSYLLRVITNQSAVPTDTPTHKVFGYADWKPLEGLDVVPSMEISSKRYLQGATNFNYYYRGGDSAVANLKVSYKIRDNVQAEIGANNIFDANYEVADGYHAPGRNYFTNLRVTF